MREITVGKLSGIAEELHNDMHGIKKIERTPITVQMAPATDKCKLVRIEGCPSYLIQNVGIEEPKFLNRKFKVEKQSMSIGKKVFLVVSTIALTTLLATYAAAQCGFLPEEQHEVTPSTYVVGGAEMSLEQYQDYLEATENYYDEEITKGRGGR